MKSLAANTTEHHEYGALHADALLPLLDGLDLVAMVVDETGQVTFCNAALLRLLHCSRAEVVGFNWFETFLEGEARAGVVELFRDILEERDIELRHQNEVVCKDGARRLVAWNNAPLRDEQSRICGMISIGSDVTQSRQTDQELQLSRLRFKTLFQNASAGMALTDASEGRILQVNDAFCRLLGYSQSALETMSAFDITHPDDHEAMIKAGHKQLEGIGGASNFEKRLLRADGTSLWTMISASLVRDQAGRPLHFISQIGDISDQKRAQHELQRAHALNDAIIDGTSDGIVVCDRDGRVLVWNPFLEKMTGQPASRVLGQPILEVFSLNRQTVSGILARTLAGETTRTGDLAWTFHDGARCWLTCSVVPLRDDKGEIIGVIGTIHDVTGRKAAEQARKHSEDRLRLTMNQITEMLLVHEVDGTIVDANRAACRVLGYSYGELLHTPLQSVAPLYNATRVLALNESCALSAPFESEQKRRDGSTFPVEVSVGLFQSGERQLVMRQARDITERKRSAEDLLRSNAILEATQEASAEGICLVENNGNVARFNRRFADLWNIPDEILDKLTHKKQIMHYVLGQLEQPDEFIDRLNYLYDNATISVRDEIRLLDGRILDRYSAPALSPQGVSYGRVWVFSDITQRKQWEQKLEQQAFYDSLTGLPNRALFVDRLAQATARARRHGERNALLFLDLDRFKVINDSLGHESGDLLLMAVAERLRACLRPEDTAARLGGDEFVVLLQGATHLEAVTRVAERIADALKTPFQLGKHEVYTAASIGIVLETDTITTPDDLLRSADLAMYRAKSRGGARYELFDEAMSIGAIDALNLETELRRALERDEFTVAYQPVIALDSGLVMGAEALVRWNSATRGAVPPNDFIPLAETTGLILPLGQRVLREACAAAQRWNEREYSRGAALSRNGAATSNAAESGAVTVSVNLSARQFQQPELLQEVREALDSSGLAPQNLMLEITESVVMEDAEATAVTLRNLKNLGVRLAIDDFGTGYSSLAYLRRFPVDILKIDRAFVSKMSGGGTEDAAIVRAIVTLAQTLGMKVTAEGVENEEQVQHLRTLGCDYAQGFLFSHALPEREIAPLLGQSPLASTR